MSNVLNAYTDDTDADDEGAMTVPLSFLRKKPSQKCDQLQTGAIELMKWKHTF